MALEQHGPDLLLERRNGVPAGRSVPRLARYDRTDQVTMIIGVEPTAIPNPHRDRLDLWDGLPAIPPLFTAYEPA